MNPPNSPGPASRARPTAIRGPVLTFTGDPFQRGLEHTSVYEPDAIVAMADGLITHFGPAESILPQLPAGTAAARTPLLPARYIFPVLFHSARS